MPDDVQISVLVKGAGYVQITVEEAAVEQQQPEEAPTAEGQLVCSGPTGKVEPPESFSFRPDSLEAAAAYGFQPKAYAALRASDALVVGSPAVYIRADIVKSWLQNKQNADYGPRL